MSYPDDSIGRLVQGERPTLIEASKGNELIDALNALRNFSIKSGDEDKVDFTSDGVAIEYKGVDSTEADRTINLINADDLTQSLSLKIKNGVIETISTGDSGIRERVIAICENGSQVNVTFLTKVIP